MAERLLKLPSWMRFGHIPHSDGSIENAHSASYVTSVWDVLGPAWTFPEVYSTISPPKQTVYSMVHGGTTKTAVEVEIRPLPPGHPPVPLGNRQLQPLPQPILPLHLRPRAPQPILPLPPPRVPQLIHPLLPPLRPPLRPLRPPPPPPLRPLPLPQFTLVLARPANWQSRLEWCRLLIRAIPRTSLPLTTSWLTLVLCSLWQR